MKTMFRRILAAAAVTLSVSAAAVGTAPAPALAAPRAAALTAQDKALVAQAESYLNGIGTMQSKFVQVSPNGHQTSGTFYLSRPGRMRLEYDPPVKDFVVADGTFIFYWDGDMRQQSSAPIGSTLADFILRKTVRLSGDVTVTGVYQAPGLVEISLTETKDPGKGTLTLVFEDRPFKLRKWRVLDAQGLTTEVALLNPREGVQFESKLFYFVEPSRNEFGRNN